MIYQHRYNRKYVSEKIYIVFDHLSHKLFEEYAMLRGEGRMSKIGSKDECKTKKNINKYVLYFTAIFVITLLIPIASATSIQKFSIDPRSYSSGEFADVVVIRDESNRKDNLKANFFMLDKASMPDFDEKGGYDEPSGSGGGPQ